MIKFYATKDLFGILVIESVNVINHVNVGEYLDYKNCKSRKKLVDKLIEECTENIDEVKIAEKALLEHGNECVYSYKICVILAVIALTINIWISAYFAYKKKILFVLRLVPVLKQQFIELINEKSQTNRDQKSNLLFLQRHN